MHRQIEARSAAIENSTDNQDNIQYGTLKNDACSANDTAPSHCRIHIYAVLEQSQTINILSYLKTKCENVIQFNSANDGPAKKAKEFTFAKICNQNDKLRYVFSDQITQIASGLLAGYSQTVFVYGTEENKKDKILIGESQNSGILLNVLSTLFKLSFDQQIEADITIKLSFTMYQNGAFNDIFSQGQKQCETALKAKTRSRRPNWLYDDPIQKKYLLGVPEIIVRNMKTALKLINIVCKKLADRHEVGENETQNVVFMAKVERRNGKCTKPGQQLYTISKLCIIKMANPSINNSLNGLSRNNNWFISLNNFLQGEAINPTRSKCIDQHTQSRHNCHQQDQFTTFIIDCALNKVCDIYNFTSITNKMTSNQCLTAFKFNNYLLAYQTVPEKFILCIDALKEEKEGLENQLINCIKLDQGLVEQENKKKQVTKGQKQTSNEFLLKHFGQESQFSSVLAQIVNNTLLFMQQSNLVEYEYAKILTLACDKLSRYIFNQEIEDFYYAKKIATFSTPTLVLALAQLFATKRMLIEHQHHLLQIMTQKIAKLTTHCQQKDKQKTANQQEYKRYKSYLSSKKKQKEILGRLFQIYDTAACHFVYEQSEKITRFLEEVKGKEEEKKIRQAIEGVKEEQEQYNEDVLLKENITDQKQNYKEGQEIEQGQEKDKSPKNQSLEIGSTTMNKTTAKNFLQRRKQQDQLENMFTNRNICIAKRSLHNKATLRN